MFKNSKTIGQAGLLSLFVLSLWSQDAHGQRLYVFLTASVRPQVIQEKLSDACPDIEITVFGRIRDFKVRIQHDPPDAILSNRVVSEQYRSYPIGLYGAANGSKFEPYVLLSIDQPIDATALSDKTIGLVDFLGRREIENFMAGIFPSNPRLKRVTKLEDLLPLITFKMADAVFVSQREAQELRRKSQLNLVMTELSDINIGLPVLAVKGGAFSEKIIDAIRNLHIDDNALLGVDTWLR